MDFELAAITLDCADPEPLAAFWAGLLGGTITYRSEQTAATRSNGLLIAAHRIDGYRPPTWPGADVPTQLHLDLRVEDPADLDAAEARAVELGATVASPQPAPALRRILLDPAGHPFCFSTQIPR